MGIPPGIIASELGVDAQIVYDDLRHAREERRERLSQDKDLIVVLEAEELEAVRRRAWEVANEEHLRVGASGNVSLHPVTGEPLHDATPALQALGILLRTQDRRTKLLGLDAIQKFEWRGEVVTLDAFDTAIADLQRRLDEHPIQPRFGPDEA
jgi:hypothetical protein